MSSGSVLIVPAAVPVAAAAAVVLAAAAAAVVIVSAAGQAAEAAVTGPADYGRALAETAEARSRAAVNHLVWETVATNVAELNARIRMIGGRVKRAGVPVAVPGPLGLAGQNAAQAARWCVRTAEELAVAQKALHQAVALAQVREAAEALPGSRSDEQRAQTAAVLDRYQEMLRRRHEPRRVSGPPPINITDAEVSAVLLKLDQDAYEHERAELLAAAAEVARNGPGEAVDCLCELRRKVSAVNKAVERRRLAACWLAVLEEPTVAATLPPDPFVGTATRLRAVVRGEADLTDDLRRDARRAVESAEESTRRAYLAAEVGSCLAGLGYTVGEEFDLRNSTTLTLRRPDWPDHLARLSVTEQGVTGFVLREQRGSGVAAALSDRQRCDVFHEDLGALGRRVGAEVTVDESARPQILESGYRKLG